MYATELKASVAVEPPMEVGAEKWRCVDVRRSDARPTSARQIGAGNGLARTCEQALYLLCGALEKVGGLFTCASWGQVLPGFKQRSAHEPAGPHVAVDA